ncbi:hypothetical protein Tco_0542013 [Tanacetum coccineum]
MAGSEDDIPPPPHHTPTKTNSLHIVSNHQTPILKKGEYDIWVMKMEHYLAHTDYPIWEVIQRGNGPMWEAIKSRFGGNDESKKMQKYILKQQFEGFSVSNSEGLHKGYDRFQSLLSQLEIHGAGVSTEMMQNQAKNSRVFESDVKGSTASSSSTQNVAFVSENTSSTNDASGLQQFRAQTTEELFVSKEIKESNAKLKKLLLGLNRDRRLGLGYGWEGAEKEVGKDLEDGGREDVWGVWDLGIPKRHVLYVEVLAILLEIVIFMRKRMAKQAELNNRMSKGSGQREIRPVWNNVAQKNHQNNLFPKANYPQRALHNKGIVDGGCSKHVTGNKAYLAEYQDFR